MKLIEIPQLIERKPCGCKKYRYAGGYVEKLCLTHVKEGLAKLNSTQFRD